MNLLKKIFQKKPVRNKEQKVSEETKLPKYLAKKMEILRPYIENNGDVISRSFLLKQEENRRAVVVYLEGIIDTDLFNRDVLKPLMMQASATRLDSTDAQNLVDHIIGTSLTVGQVKKFDTASGLKHSLFDGTVVLLVEGLVEGVSIDVRGGTYRSIEEPTTEKTLRGSKEGFNESLSTNISLIRRKIRDPEFVVEKVLVGKRSRTDVAIAYIRDLADPEIVSEIRNRITKIDIDGVMDTGYIEQFIEDNPFSPFPQSEGTERPDKAIANILEGRVVVMANGTPFALIYPSVFVQFLQAQDDYYERAYIGSLYRFLRTMAFFVAISLPAIYVALLSFNQELIPLNLIISLAQNRKQVPFPVAVEAFLLELIIQLVIETGLRLPAPIAQTIGVVGGIILGQTAVTAHLASPAILIVITMTTICTFAMASYGMAAAIRVIGLPLFVLSASFGLFGFSLGWLIILAHLVSLESMGVPYFAPIAPLRFGDLKDSFIRTFIFKLARRPESIPMQGRKRMDRRKQ